MTATRKPRSQMQDPSMLREPPGSFCPHCDIEYIFVVKELLCPHCDVLPPIPDIIRSADNKQQAFNGIIAAYGRKTVGASNWELLAKLPGGLCVGPDWLADVGAGEIPQ